MKGTNLFSLAKESFKEWQEDGALQLGAALSYYTIFSIAPLLLIAIAIAGVAFGREAVEGQLVGQIEGLVGRQGAEAVQTMIANAGKHGQGVLPTVLGIATILFGATGVFVQLQDSLNKIWDVKPKPGGGVKAFLMQRVISFGMVLGIGFLLLVSLIFAAGVAALDEFATGLLPGAETLIGILGFLVSFALVTLLFAMIYRVLPDVEIAWRDVWVGAGVTALLFTIGKYLIGLYLGNSSVASAYGAAGSLVVVLLWVYYSSQILFLGAEFTQVYATRYGSRIVPSEGAVRVDEEGERRQRKTERRQGRERRQGWEAGHGGGEAPPRPAS
jgi:membrane protein